MSKTLKGFHIPADTSMPFKIIDINSLDDMQAAVGGYIEAVSIPSREIDLYCNEEGKLRHLPFNLRASMLWEQLWGAPLNDCLVGDVLMLGGVDNEGDNTDIPEHIIKTMQKLQKESNS